VTDEGRIVESGPISLSAESDATANPTLERSSAEGQQTFSVERGKHELKAAADKHKQDEEKKDNKARRQREGILFGVVLLVVLASWVTGFGMALFAENDWRQALGRDIVFLVLGGLLGGVAGYFTGKAAK